MIATGIRWNESTSRKSRAAFEVLAHSKKNAIFVSDEKMLLDDNDERRKLFERCELKAKTVVNSIIDWKDADIWEYIEAEHICVNCLYKEGFNRVGCIGCPMAGKKRWFEFRIFPNNQKRNSVMDS